MNSQKKSSTTNMFLHKLSSICKLSAERKILELMAKCLVLTFLWSFTCPLPAIADVFNVTTTADTIDGAGLSLRDAIIDANTNPGQDTINLPAGIYLFQLSGRGESTAATGDLDIRDDLVMNGSGQESTIVDANDLDGVFEIIPGKLVEMNDLTIQNGLRELINSNGAGIVNAGELILNNVTVTGNRSTNGGGLLNTDQMTLNNVTVTSNSAIKKDGLPSTGFGGGIFNNTGASLVIDNSTFDNNLSENNGAGIFNNSGAEITINDLSSFSGNVSQAYGGAISNSGDLTISGTTFDQNIADDGGAIANLNNSTLFVANSTFTDNEADGANLGGGGAIFIYLSDATISGTTFTGNIAYGEGGGAIACRGNLYLSESTLTLNEARIHASFDEVGTSPGLGGALYFVNPSNITVTGTIINNNSAGIAGGAVYNDPGSTLNITSCQLNNNQVTSGVYLDKKWYGGGIHTGGALNLNLSTLSNNEIGSVDSLGGGICTFFSGATTTITNSTISNNSAASGGGISHQSAGGVLTIKNSTLSQNSATGAMAYGGGLHSNHPALIENSTFTGNTSTWVGGAISANGSAATIGLTNVTITNNTAGNIASGIYCWMGTVTTVNSVIDGTCNSWHQPEGTSVGDENDSSPVDLGGNLESPGDTCYFTASSSQYNVTGPLFAALADNGGPTQTHLPLPGSPLIDEGENAHCPAIDQIGSYRPFDGLGDMSAVCDIGAVEYGSTPADNDTDGDTIPDNFDNCPNTFNSEQLDADIDGIGDVCDDTPGCGGCGEPSCEKSLTEKVEELLTHYYWNILGRTPDPGGLNYWTDVIINLVSSGDDIKEGFISFAQAFFNSQEYLDRNRDDEEYVTDLYKTFFDRPPDQGGLDYWTGQLSQGMSRNEVLDYFVHSPEFNAFMDELFFGIS